MPISAPLWTRKPFIRVHGQSRITYERASPDRYQTLTTGTDRRRRRQYSHSAETLRDTLYGSPLASFLRVTRGHARQTPTTRTYHVSPSLRTNTRADTRTHSLTTITRLFFLFLLHSVASNNRNI